MRREEKGEQGRERGTFCRSIFIPWCFSVFHESKKMEVGGYLLPDHSSPGGHSSSGVSPRDFPSSFGTSGSYSEHSPQSHEAIAHTMKPFLLINFKLYRETMGVRALEMARQLAKVKREKYQIALAPSLLEVISVAQAVKVPVFAPHADPVTTGPHTGAISLQELHQGGVRGVILNHSERRIPFSQLKKTVILAKKQKLAVVVCTSDLREVPKIARLQPDFLAYEPSELIGGNISVTAWHPGRILQIIRRVKNISPLTRVLCGAGVHAPRDVQTALRLGADGVLIGHAVPRASNPGQFLQRMLGGS